MSRKPLKHSEQKRVSAAAKMKSSWGKPRSGPFQPIAMANAEKLENMNKGKSPAECNPGTNVHKLVKELLPYTKPEVLAHK